MKAGIGYTRNFKPLLILKNRFFSVLRMNGASLEGGIIMHQTEDTQWLLNAVEALAQTAVSGGEYWRATYTDQDR